MADAPESGTDKRRHPRYPANKPTRTVSRDRHHEGTLKDLSVSGASITPAAEFETGDLVEVDIEDVGSFPGRVARTPDDDLFAIAFDIDEDDEEPLLAEVTRLHDDLVDEEF